MSDIEFLNECRAGNIKEVKKMLGKGLRVDPPGEGVSPLMASVVAGKVEVAKLLIESGANLDRTMEGTGLGALHFACMQGDAAMVECLLRAGADALAESNLGRPADLARDNVVSAFLEKAMLNAMLMPATRAKVSRI